MQLIRRYESPLGGILLAADEIGLTGLWFAEENGFADRLGKEYSERDTAAFTDAVRWLDIYFSGREPDFTPPLHAVGSSFRQAVWQLLLQIPYGNTVTYGQLAQTLAKQRGILRMSAQAVGGAVGHNPISVIIPCHRVIGADGSLTGYAGGVEQKRRLLELERVDPHSFFVPKSYGDADSDKRGCSH